MDDAKPARPVFPWEKSYPVGVDWHAPIATYPLTELLDRSAETFGSRRFLDYRGSTLTFTDLKSGADRFAAALMAAGIGYGDTLALYLPNSPVHPVGFFGALRTGARVAHLSPLDAPLELAHKLEDSGARTLLALAGGKMADAALKLLDAGHVDTVILARDFGAAEKDGAGSIPERPDVVSFDDFVAEVPIPKHWPNIDKADIALLQFTGGTTGRAKAAQLTHANLSAATEMYQHWYEGQGRATRNGEVVVGVLPFFHIYALTTVMLRQLRSGGTILLHQRFDATQVLDDISVKKATSFPGVPTMWIALAQHPEIGRRDLSSLKMAASGGAPLPVEISARLTQLTGLKLKGGWGMTETSPAGTNLPFEGPEKPGTIGLPMPGVELDIVDIDDGHRVLHQGETGELRVRGLNVTAGYFERPEETAKAVIGDRFLTGDIGYMDEDGYFFIVDRKKDMIISGGFNVYPQMIEQAIYEHEDVAECLVVGVPDSYRGEAAKAYVTLKSGAATFDIETLRGFLADRLGRHELPAALEIRDALPRTPVGKLSKTALREEMRAEYRAAQAVAASA